MTLFYPFNRILKCFTSEINKTYVNERQSKRKTVVLLYADKKYVLWLGKTLLSELVIHVGRDIGEIQEHRSRASNVVTSK